MNVELYSRQNCHLCDAARETLRSVQQEIPFELHEIDIDRDPLLRERYTHDVPVVFIDGKAWFKHKLDREEMVKRLERARAFALGTLDPQKTLSRTAPVSRATKVGFAIACVLAIAAVFVSKGYVKFVLDRQRAESGLELMKQDRPAPDFSLLAENGAQKAISAYRGQVLVLNFFATWCAPCREELPSMNALAANMKDQKVAVLAVDVEEGWPVVNRFFAAQQPSFDVAVDPTGDAARAYEQKSGLQYPETFILTPDGRVVAKFEGARDWTDPAMVGFLKRLRG